MNSCGADDERLAGGKPAFEDEALAPAVDRPLLAALARGELSDEAARGVYRFVVTFKSWNDAHAEAVAEEFRRSREGRNERGESRVESPERRDEE